MAQIFDFFIKKESYKKYFLCIFLFHLIVFLSASHAMALITENEKHTVQYYEERLKKTQETLKKNTDYSRILIEENERLSQENKRLEKKTRELHFEKQSRYSEIFIDCDSELAKSLQSIDVLENKIKKMEKESKDFFKKLQNCLGVEDESIYLTNEALISLVETKINSSKELGNHDSGTQNDSNLTKKNKYNHVPSKGFFINFWNATKNNGLLGLFLGGLGVWTIQKYGLLKMAHSLWLPINNT